MIVQDNMHAASYGLLWTRRLRTDQKTSGRFSAEYPDIDAFWSMDAFDQSRLASLIEQSSSHIIGEGHDHDIRARSYGRYRRFFAAKTGTRCD
jgi:hypothetical protein